MDQPSPSIEQRLRRLEDLEQIRALLHDYQRALDTRDLSSYAGLFVADGVFRSGSVVASGRSEIQALVEGMRGGLLAETVGDDAHLLANISIVLDGDEAEATSTWIYVVRNTDPQLAKLGHYADRIVRDDGVWRFAERRAEQDMPKIDL